MSCQELIVSFVKKYGVNIISDGDLDGIFATSLLLLKLHELGFAINLKKSVRFPHPQEVKGMQVSNSILIELPQSKGLIYKEENLLIDHHPEPARIELYSGNSLIKRIVINNARSAASLVLRALNLKLPDIAIKIINAVDNIDNLSYESEFDKLLHAAYSLHIDEPEMRFMLVEKVLSHKWDEIIEWAINEGRRYLELVPRKIEELTSRSKEILPGVAIFTYDNDSKIEKAAVTTTMMNLEKKYKIVIALGIRKGVPESARIATMQDIDLTSIFNEIVNKYGKLGITAGGRKNVGGVQFRGSTIKNVDEAITIIINAIKQTTNL